MELRHLRYFVAVAEEENVSRAALRLNVSQPPLSRQIRDLEAELGVELFTRTAKSLNLTAEGRLFLGEARSILQRVDEAVRTVRATAARGEAEIRVGYAPSPTGEFLSAVLHRFQRLRPGVRVALHDMTTSEMLEGLRKRRLEAALMVNPMSLEIGAFRWELLRSYRVGVVMPKNHRWAGRRVLRIEEILAEPIAVLSKRDYPDYHAWLRRTTGEWSRKFRAAEECDGALSLIAAVESGRAVAVSAESIISVAGSRLVFVPLSPAPEPLQVGICLPASLARLDQLDRKNRNFRPLMRL
jgi:DNA-binding transcriptional LysR family regulator